MNWMTFAWSQTKCEICFGCQEWYWMAFVIFGKNIMPPITKKGKQISKCLLLYQIVGQNFDIFMLFVMTNVKYWKYSTRLEQGALSSEVSKSPIFIVGMVSQLYQPYNQSSFLTILTFPWRFSFLLWSSLLSFLASTSDTKRSKKNSKLSLLRIDTYYWIIGVEIEFKMKYHYSNWTILTQFELWKWILSAQSWRVGLSGVRERGNWFLRPSRSSPQVKFMMNSLSFELSRHGSGLSS